MNHLKDFFNRSSVRPQLVSTQFPDDRILSRTLFSTRGRGEGEISTRLAWEPLLWFFSLSL